MGSSSGGSGAMAPPNPKYSLREFNCAIQNHFSLTRPSVIATAPVYIYT